MEDLLYGVPLSWRKEYHELKQEVYGGCEICAVLLQLAHAFTGAMSSEHGWFTLRLRDDAGAGSIKLSMMNGAVIFPGIDFWTSKGELELVCGFSSRVADVI